MTTICAECGGFVEFIAIKNNLYVICKNGHKAPFDGTEVIETYPGIHQTQTNTLTDRVMENLSYEQTMPIASDQKCKKCNVNVIYAIEPTTGLYRYACQKCHRVVL